MSNPYQDPYNQPPQMEACVISKLAPPTGPGVPVPLPGPPPPLMPIPGTSGAPTTGGYPRQSSDPSPSQYSQSPPSYQEATQPNANNTGGYPFYPTPTPITNTAPATNTQPIATHSTPSTTYTQPPMVTGYNVGYHAQTYGTMYTAQQPPPPPPGPPSGSPINYTVPQPPYNPHNSSPPGTQTNYNYTVNYSYHHYPPVPPTAPPTQTTTSQNYSPTPPSPVPNYSIPTTNYNYTVPTTYNVTMPYQQPTNTGQQTTGYPQPQPQPQPQPYPTFNTNNDGSAVQQPQTSNAPGVTNVQPPYGYS
jgi:hypothetical protein